MNYFDHVKTAEGLKRAYRSYCLKLHPDKGGDAKAFVEMKTQYEVWKKVFEKPETKIQPEPVTFKDLKKKTVKKVARQFVRKKFGGNKVRFDFRYENNIYLVDLDELIDGIIDKLF